MSNDIILEIIMYGVATANLLCIFYTGICHRRRMRMLDKTLADIKNAFYLNKHRIIVYDPISNSFELYDKNFYCVTQKPASSMPKEEHEDKSNQ